MILRDTHSHKMTQQSAALARPLHSPLRSPLHLFLGLSLGLLILCFTTVKPASAQSVYVYMTPDGSRLITNTPTKQPNMKLLKVYEPVASIRSLPNKRRTETRKLKPIESVYDSLIQRTAAQYKLDSALVKAIVHIESSFNTYAVSPKGALGLMQLMPGTAEQFSVDDPFDAQSNLKGGSQYFSQLMQRYENDVHKALAAYNAGEKAVDNYNGIPPYPETQAYVSSVLSLHRQYQDQLIKGQPLNSELATKPHTEAKI